MLELREEIQKGHKQEARNLNLDEQKELPIFHIVEAEVKEVLEQESLNHEVHEEALQLARDIAGILEQETQIVDFFNKQDEIKRTKLKIKRMIIDTSFDDETLRNRIMDRVIQQARTIFAK